jgi:hypothetical protein
LVSSLQNWSQFSPFQVTPVIFAEDNMRQPAIPKLSELSTAGRAELLAIWTATLGKPPAALRASRELLASALAWQLQERKFGGLTAATNRFLASRALKILCDASVARI